MKLELYQFINSLGFGTLAKAKIETLLATAAQSICRTNSVSVS